MAIKNVRIPDTPANNSGAMITIPSGMFCKAILNDTNNDASPAELLLILTPAAMPSGHL